MTTAHQPDGDAIARLSAWVVAEGLGDGGLGRLIEGVCHGLQQAGLPLLRMHVALSTLHPTYTGIGGTWQRDRGVLEEAYARRREGSTPWQSSPLRTMMDGRLPRMRRRLDAAGPLDYAVLEEFRAEGGTDWFARLVPFGGKRQRAGLPGMLVTWLTDAPGGFREADIEALERLLPSFALACYRLALEGLAENLLEAYLGRETGRHILAGQIQRGQASPLAAVVFLADFRGFTRLADEMPGDALLSLLNRALGDVAEALEAAGGQVMKFLGDGLLGVFPLAGEAPSDVCARALQAARAALAGNARLAAEAEASGGRGLVLDLALHLGDLLYGNVGSDRRLDFTVIGPAVNEASRIEALCEPLGRQLLISASFAEAYGGPLASLGRHALRGVARPQALFTLPD